MPQASVRFFGNDWRSDARLRLCSAAARGVWIDLMSFMMEAQPFGSLLINGERPTIEQIAALTVTPVRIVKKGMEELERNGVYSVDPDGTIYSRRMRRDAQRAAEATLNGKKGGNPKLKGHDGPDDKPKDKGGGYEGGLTPYVKPHGNTPNPTPSPIPKESVVDTGTAGGERYAFEGEVIKLNAADLENWRNAYHSIPDLVAELTTIDAKFRGKRPVNWFSTCSAWLRKEHERRLGQGHGRGTNGDAATLADDGLDSESRTYRTLVRLFKDRGEWTPERGPAPGKPGCRVPRWILREFGYEAGA